jgi:hypothetical protein
MSEDKVREEFFKAVELLCLPLVLDRFSSGQWANVSTEMAYELFKQGRQSMRDECVNILEHRMRKHPLMSGVLQYAIDQIKELK